MFLWFYPATQRVFITSLTASKSKTSTLIMLHSTWQENNQTVLWVGVIVCAPVKITVLIQMCFVFPAVYKISSNQSLR